MLCEWKPNGRNGPPTIPIYIVTVCCHVYCNRNCIKTFAVCQTEHMQYNADTGIGLHIHRAFLCSVQVGNKPLHLLWSRNVKILKLTELLQIVLITLLVSFIVCPHCMPLGIYSIFYRNLDLSIYFQLNTKITDVPSSYSQCSLGIVINAWWIYLCFNIFESVYDQVQMASASLPHERRKNVCSETSVTACEPRSLNDLPEEILLKIFSHFGPEDLCLIIAKVCEKWNVLAKDVVLWKKLSYECVRSSDISRIAEVRCTTLFEFSTN
jgi:hypothetical protein